MFGIKFNTILVSIGTKNVFDQKYYIPGYVIPDSKGVLQLTC